MLSDALLHEAQSLIYAKWAEAFDVHKAVKAEKPDGTPDWEEFHAERLANAQSRLAKYASLLAEINQFAPLTRKT